MLPPLTVLRLHPLHRLRTRTRPRCEQQDSDVELFPTVIRKKIVFVCKETAAGLLKEAAALDDSKLDPAQQQSRDAVRAKLQGFAGTAAAVSALALALALALAP
jgi:hypothetical protein